MSAKPHLDKLNAARKHKEFPIYAEVVWRFVQEIQAFVEAAWHDPDEAIHRGSFI
ncbi:hypothetical protein H8E77_29490 [bacterium]|nr:hypothetical protein [bacterium]